MSNFKEPNFSTGQIEVGTTGQEIRIYATADGLSHLIKFCKDLLSNPKQGHIHLSDYKILTSKSLKTVIAIFLAHDK